MQDIQSHTGGHNLQNRGHLPSTEKRRNSSRDQIDSTVYRAWNPLNWATGRVFFILGSAGPCVARPARLRPLTTVSTVWSTSTRYRSLFVVIRRELRVPLPRGQSGCCHCGLVILKSSYWVSEGVLAEWSKALASGASGATRAGSNPADINNSFFLHFGAEDGTFYHSEFSGPASQKLPRARSSETGRRSPVSVPSPKRPQEARCVPAPLAA
jgi:hypothetical protein